MTFPAVTREDWVAVIELDLAMLAAQKPRRTADRDANAGSIKDLREALERLQGGEAPC